MEDPCARRDIKFDFSSSQSSMDSAPPVTGTLSSPEPEQQASKRRKVDSGFQSIRNDRKPATTSSLFSSSFSFPLSPPLGRTPRKPSGPLTLRRAKPIKSHVPYEIWLNIFSFCTPQTLAKLRRVNHTFKSFISDEKVWATSRGNNFPHFPAPIFGYPENYMWNLWKGMGCMICGSARVKKVYWTWGVRMCFDCFKDGRMKADEIYGTGDFCQNAKKCLRHCFISGRSVTTERDIYYGGEPAYWRDEVETFKEEYYRRKRDDNPELLKVFLEFEKNKTVELMKAASELQRFEKKESTARREEIAAIRKQRNVSIPEKCKSDFEPPISEEVLTLMPSYQSALRSGSAFTERSWRTLAKKLQAERKGAEDEHNSRQKLRSKILQAAVDKKREEREKEREDNETLQVIKLAMPHLLREARECVKTEAGALVVDPSLSASFLVETLGYVWRSWDDAHPNSKLSMRGVFYLWETFFASLPISGDLEFKCQFCEHRAGFKGIINHVTEEHGTREESVASWARDSSRYINSPNWDGAIWPEVLPFFPAGTQFRPREPCNSFWSMSKPYPVVKQSKGWKLTPIVETSNLRHSIIRSVQSVSGLEVPAILKLLMFLTKLSKEETFSGPHHLNSVYYELLRIPDKHDIEFFKNDYIFCKICIEKTIMDDSHPGNGDFLELIEHFCQEHHADIDSSKPEGPDWRRDMVLLPGASDIKRMYHSLPDAMSKKWDRVNETTGLDLKTCEATIEEENRGDRVPPLLMHSWKYTRSQFISELLLVSPVLPASPACDPLDPAFWEVPIQMNLANSFQV